MGFSSDHLARLKLLYSYHPIDSRGLEGPFNTDNSALTATPKNKGVAKTVANVPPVFAGMDKAEALAYVSRLFDAAQARPLDLPWRS